MADRFPSIEDIDEGQIPSNEDGGFEDVGEDDFLARERRVLGDEFGTPQAATVPSVSVDDPDPADDDLLGGGANGAQDDIAQFQSSFPDVNAANNAVGPGGTITGTPAPFLPGVPSNQARPYSPAAVSYPPEDEPEVIKVWRATRDEQIEKREAVAAQRREQTVKDAQQSIDEFYENYNNKKDRGVKQTRQEAEEFLAGRENTTAGGTSWQRIGKLVDIKPGAGRTGAGALPGKERFRELLGSLMKDENAPGAKGY